MEVKRVENPKTFDLGIINNFVATEYINKMADKAILYMNNGYPVHLRGSAGVGKTSLAFYIANRIGRPMLFLCGSEEVNDSNLIGGYFGVKSRLIEDNYISSVYKREEELKKIWSDGRLLTACKNGYTVIYDEFTRARPEVNNVLLSILEEKVVDVPYNSSSSTYLKIDPEFRIIFTSNPEEYVGVYKSPNALIDRMITIDMDYIDTETEKSIVIARSGIDERDAERILRLTRYVKSQIGSASYASLRSSIMLAKVVKGSKIKMDASNDLFRQCAKDIYNSVNIAVSSSSDKKRSINNYIDRAIDTVFAGS
jgi:nitric oxide reductase NorQ protein